MWFIRDYMTDQKLVHKHETATKEPTKVSAKEESKKVSSALPSTKPKISVDVNLIGLT
jgi:hypothetical protein